MANKYVLSKFCGRMTEEEIQEMRKRGVTYNIIADFCGVSLRALKRWIARHSKRKEQTPE